MTQSTDRRKRGHDVIDPTLRECPRIRVVRGIDGLQQPVGCHRETPLRPSYRRVSAIGILIQEEHLRMAHLKEWIFGIADLVARWGDTAHLCHRYLLTCRDTATSQYPENRNCGVGHDDSR